MIEKKSFLEKENPFGLMHLGVMCVRPGHTLFEINHVTKSITPAEYVEGPNGKKSVFVKEGCEYIPALNLKNAVKRYNKSR